MVILQQMIIFFIMMILGMVSRKLGYITTQNQNQLSAIVVNIANPAMILSGSIQAGERMPQEQLLYSFGIAIGIFAVMILFGKILPKLLQFSKENQGIVEAMFVFSNIGFMGMPMVQQVYGQKGLMYVTLFLIPFNVLVYTYGIAVISKRQDSVRQRTSVRERIADICNIGVIACIVAVILYFVPVKIPYVVTESITMLSKLTGPFSMMIIGASFLDISLKEIFTDIRLLFFGIVKLLIIPIVTLLVLKVFVSNQLLLGVCLVMLAAPVASMVAMLTNRCNEEQSGLATKGVALTTVLSVITMPLVSMITGIS